MTLSLSQAQVGGPRSCMTVACAEGHEQVVRILFLQEGAVFQPSEFEAFYDRVRDWALASVTARRYFNTALFGMHINSGSPHLSKLRAIQKARVLVVNFCGVFVGSQLRTIRELSEIPPRPPRASAPKASGASAEMAQLNTTDVYYF